MTERALASFTVGYVTNRYFEGQAFLMTSKVGHTQNISTNR